MATLYVIRRPDGSVSSPLQAIEIENRIRSGELSGTDELSLYPNEFSLPARDYIEFEKAFRGDGTEILPTHTEISQITRLTPDTDAENEKTILFEHNIKPTDPHEDKTSLIDATALRNKTDGTSAGEHSTRTNARPPQLKGPAPVAIDEFVDRETKQQATVVLERPKELLSKDEKKVRPSEKRKKFFGFTIPKKSFLVMMMLFLIAYDMFFDDDDAKKSKQDVVMVPVRPQLPSGGTGKVDPESSVKIYGAALKPYLEDTVQGYRRAVNGFQLALRYDPQNVKALAMLASSYLNLIDSSNKDENTFSVINKLIELSRLKQLDLVETLMAEVEFLAASNRYDAGIQKLIDYSKVSGKFDAILYFYLAWLYSETEDYASAMKYLNLIPASALPMPRLYYLRGYLHEQNKEYDEAVAEYRRALTLNPKHAKSILGLVRVAEKKGELKNVGRYIEFLVGNPSYQSPDEYIKALIYRSKIALLANQPDEAINSLERAIRIDPKDENLRLEYYTLLSSSGKDSKYKALAQMYALVLDGERSMKAGKIHEAQTVLLQAQDTFPRSTLPYEKMGDLFYQTGEFERAQASYKRALEIEPRAATIAVKLIDALIRNHEWDDAQKFLARYRAHPQLKSSIDRLAGDLSFAQSNYTAAIQYYRKAMARDSIDTQVYSSYANALSAVDQCKDAQFFYSIAERLDPFNYSAILGSAKCLMKTENTDSAVGRIQSELARLPKARADLLTGIAEIYNTAHEDDKALQFTQQAKDIDADYPETYRVEGEIYLREMVSKKDAKKKALEAFKSYSDRKPSDPYGYLERFELFLKDSKFEEAAVELNRVFEVSPRFPGLHYRRAQMYSKMGRMKDALGELEAELKLNPRMIDALVERGDILVKAGSLDDAMKSYVTAMQIDPQSAKAKVGAGYVNYQKRQFPSAIALYLSALGLDRGNPDIYKKLGFAYRDSGEQGKAAQAFQSYLDLSPDAPDRAQFQGLIHY